MAQEIVVVEGPNRFGKAYVRRRDIKYGWRAYHPTSIELVQSAGGTVGTVVGGAVIGGLLTGGIGAVVGGLAGGRAGRTAFVIETVEQKQFVCQCANKHYPGVYAAVSKMVAGNEPARATENRGSSLAAAAAVRPAPTSPVAGRGSQAGCFMWLLRIVVGLLLLVVLMAVAASLLTGPPPSP